MAAIVTGGDTGVFGWLQTILYFVATWACFRRFRHPPSARLPGFQSTTRAWSEARVWLFIALACLLLGLNKQLDVQTWLIWKLKMLAWKAGLAEEKYLVRKVAILAACGLVFVAGVYALRVVRLASRGLRYAMLGLVLLGPFAALRLARFSGLPSLRKGGGALDVALELLPTILVLAGAVGRGPQLPRRPQ